MVPQLTSGSTKYPYLYTAVQSQTVAQEATGTGTACSCSPVLLDDTTTVIDGGKIITGSIDANAINANTISGSSLTISSFKDSDNYLNSNIQVGGRNLLPITELYYSDFTKGKSHSVGGLTFIYEGDGWFRVSGTRSGTSQMSLNLWANENNDYASPVNDHVPQNGGETLTATIEVEGTPFIEADLYSNTTHIVMYGPSASLSKRFGGYTGLSSSFTWTEGNYISAVRYYIGANAAGSVNGRFRVKLERGNRATDWSPAPEDQTAYIDESINNINVGGRNLLRRTANSFPWVINTTSYVIHHLYSTGSTDVAYDGPQLADFGLATGDSVTLSFDWEISVNDESDAITYGTF